MLAKKTVSGRKPLQQAGDTIVEVMIVLAILALAFSIGMATATRGLNQSRNAEEHDQALGILDGQIELVRTAIAKKTDVPGETSYFCMNGTTITPLHTAPGTPEQDSADGYTAYTGCQQLNFYNIALKNTSANGVNYLTAQVRWDGVGGLGPQQENFVYRIYKMSDHGADYVL